MSQLQNSSILNPILARKDFPSKGLARYKKCQQKRNNYIQYAVGGGTPGSLQVRQGSAKYSFLAIGAGTGSLVINVPSPFIGCPQQPFNTYSSGRVAGCALPMKD